jgi:hypothetical protein
MTLETIAVEKRLDVLNVGDGLGAEGRRTKWKTWIRCIARRLASHAAREDE